MKKQIALFAIATAAFLALPTVTPAQDAAAPDATAPAKKHHEGSGVHGKVSAVDATAMTVTVTAKDGDKTITVTSDTKITKDGADAQFSDITVGEMIIAACKQDGDKLTATKIMIGKAKKKA
jgi:Domain of unknown function (DUF5666)